MLRAGVIGCGYWGPNIIRNLDALPEVDLMYIADLNTDQLNKQKALYPHVTITTNYQDIIKDPSIDMVLIVTPVNTHYHFAKEALMNGKHVFIEKPLTNSVKSSTDLCKMAESKNLTLMVGHTFIYTSAVRKMKEIIDSGEIGEIKYISSQRLNMGLYQRDINVLWDLAPHDLSIVDYLIDGQITKVEAYGQRNVNPELEDTAFLNLTFSNGEKVYIMNSWQYPEKVRKMAVIGTEGMIIYDDMESEKKVKVFLKHVDISQNDNGEVSYSYMNERDYIPELVLKEALHVELAHFADCVRNNKEPLTSGNKGLNVVKVLEESDFLLRSNKK
ncbi:Gfo/Idh/MocA family oxidoreductase [Neobacillus sp. PS2-9]|uniref:Gfo/Idh/MocA family protein n=1 Tax=Neobacillus sp. PS2-9 TaxID=3070676 RepID=UPI0027E1C498|nr:Gfo/Idh/MocA family oxidoreductase [Neobacillus sp. PS2-9]WML58022.1 Gfo/Idh/MocA family oxidoreductase [Neobacillus sp. PS2-9]